MTFARLLAIRLAFALFRTPSSPGKRKGLTQLLLVQLLLHLDFLLPGRLLHRELLRLRRLWPQHALSLETGRFQTTVLRTKRQAATNMTDQFK